MQDLLADESRTTTHRELLATQSLETPAQISGPYLDYTPEKIESDDKVETDLAKRRAQAPAEARGKLCVSIYDEMPRRLPYHPQLVGEDGTPPIDRWPSSKRHA
jgi:hypothetical protein